MHKTLACSQVQRLQPNGGHFTVSVMRGRNGKNCQQLHCTAMPRASRSKSARRYGGAFMCTRLHAIQQ